MLSVPIANVEVTVQIVFGLAVRTKTQWLVLNFFLLLPGQEESLVSQNSYMMDQTDSVEDVRAIEDPYVLICHKHRLLADRADTVSKRKNWVILLAYSSLRRKEVHPLTH